MTAFDRWLVSALPLVAFIVLMAPLCYSSLESDNGFLYGAMIDAGSSGTRLSIYKWIRPTSGGGSTRHPIAPTLLTNPSFKIKPGLSSFSSNSSSAGASLAPLLKKAVSFMVSLNVLVPMEEIPVYLKATGGLRLLPTSVQAAIIKSVNDFLSSSECLFYFVPGMARVISGEEEGMFGWLTVNSLSNSFSSPMGALDLGGASTQITFLPDVPIDEDLARLNLAYSGNYIELYSHSYLQYGNDAMMVRYRQLLVTFNGNSNPVVGDPCWPSGFSQSWVNPSNNIKYTLNGNATDSKLCSKLISPLLLSNKQVPYQKDIPFCPNEPCALNGVYMPPIPSSKTFVAFGSYCNQAAFFKLNNTLRQFQDLLNESSVICAMDWKALNDTYGPQPYLEEHCFAITYAALLPTLGYGIDPSAKVVSLACDINREELGWTLGAMIYEAEQLPYNQWQYGMESSKGWMVSAIVLIVLICVAVLTAAYFYRRAVSTAEETSSNAHRLLPDIKNESLL